MSPVKMGKLLLYLQFYNALLRDSIYLTFLFILFFTLVYIISGIDVCDRLEI